MPMFSIPQDMGRKDRRTGKVKEWTPEDSTPRFREFVLSYILLEMRAEIYVARKLNEAADSIGEYKKKHLRSLGEKLIEEVTISRWLAERSGYLAAVSKRLFPEWMEEVIFVKGRALWNAGVGQMPLSESLTSGARRGYRSSRRATRGPRVVSTGE
jgi:hypothetical protein